MQESFCILHKSFIIASVKCFHHGPFLGTLLVGATPELTLVKETPCHVSSTVLNCVQISTELGSSEAGTHKRDESSNQDMPHHSFCTLFFSFENLSFYYCNLHGGWCGASWLVASPLASLILMWSKLTSKMHPSLLYHRSLGYWICLSVVSPSSILVLKEVFCLHNFPPYCGSNAFQLHWMRIDRIANQVTMILFFFFHR